MLAADDVLLNTIQFNAGSRHLAYAARLGTYVFALVEGMIRREMGPLV